MDLTNVISAVHHVTGISPEQMNQQSRKREIVDARQWVFYFAKGNLREIGEVFKKDHATVIHARKAKQVLIEVDKETKKQYRKIKAYLNGSDSELMEMCVNCVRL